jgi:hypothetical protein
VLRRYYVDPGVRIGRAVCAVSAKLTLDGRTYSTAGDDRPVWDDRHPYRDDRCLCNMVRDDKHTHSMVSGN